MDVRDHLGEPDQDTVDGLVHLPDVIVSTSTLLGEDGPTLAT